MHSALSGHRQCIALHDQFQDGLHRIVRGLPGATTDKTEIPTHPGVGAGPDDAHLEQGDIYLKLPDNSRLARLCGAREIVIDVSRKVTHDKKVNAASGVPGHPTAEADAPTKHLHNPASAKYRKHARPYVALNIASPLCSQTR